MSIGTEATVISQEVCNVRLDRSVAYEMINDLGCWRILKWFIDTRKTWPITSHNCLVVWSGQIKKKCCGRCNISRIALPNWVLPKLLLSVMRQ